MDEENDVLVRFGARLRALRRQAALSQEKLGLEAGLEQAYVSDIELGRRNVSLKNIAAIARVLNVTLSVLFEGI